MKKSGKLLKARTMDGHIIIEYCSHFTVNNKSYIFISEKRKKIIFPKKLYAIKDWDNCISIVPITYTEDF